MPPHLEVEARLRERGLSPMSEGALAIASEVYRDYLTRSLAERIPEDAEFNARLTLGHLAEKWS